MKRYSRNKIEELKIEKEKLVKEMILRSNQALYKNYLSLKRLIEINKELYGQANHLELAEQLSCDERQIQYMLRFDRLKDKGWLDKIPVNVILLTLNWNEDVAEEQETHFKYFEEHKYNADKARIYLIKEYVKSQGLEGQELPHYLYRKVQQGVLSLKKFIFMAKKSTMTKEQKKQLLEMIKDLIEETEGIYDEEIEITSD
jgi:hypothetical protein